MATDTHEPVRGHHDPLEAHVHSLLAGLLAISEKKSGGMGLPKNWKDENAPRAV